LSSEDDLIRWAQAGETDAFCLLVKAYERRIYSLAFFYCRDRQDAEDLSQEVWLKAYAALATFRNESAFYTWLRKITINCFLNYRRRRRLRLPWSSQGHNVDQAGDFRDQPDSGATGAFEINLQNQLVVEKIMQGLALVTPQQRLIFLLKHQEGMTYEEIARELGCSRGTVKKSVSRTLGKLRAQLGVPEGPESYISCAAAGVWK
jgi:RNA polymerase sigma-70 factor, ECF subfamily